MSTFRAREIFNNSTLMLIAVESIQFRNKLLGTSCQIYCNIEPIAVIVCTQDTSYALDMEANPAALDQLMQDVPEMDTFVTAFRNLRDQEY